MPCLSNSTKNCYIKPQRWHKRKTSMFYFVQRAEKIDYNLFDSCWYICLKYLSQKAYYAGT